VKVRKNEQKAVEEKLKMRELLEKKQKEKRS